MSANRGDVSDEPTGQRGWVRIDDLAPDVREALIRAVCPIEPCERCGREVFATVDRTVGPQRRMLDLAFSVRHGQWVDHDANVCATARILREEVPR